MTSPKKHLLRAAGRRAAALLRRAELRALASIASDGGQRIWIVGGAARDLLLKRPVPEVDVAVSGDVKLLARAMERAGFGRAVPLSARSPRVFRIAGRREVDLAEIEDSSIEQDLRRRDFTVNAMALDLAAREWLDPFGGLADLAAGRLRLVSPHNLAEDPLRTLRAARLIATHGLEPDAEVLETSLRVAPALAGVALERVRVEWIKMFEARRAAPALRWAFRARVLGPALRIGAREERTLARSAEFFDAPAVVRRTPESRRRLRLALLCAKLGLKPREATAWLRARRYGRAEAGEVASLLELADDAREADTPRRQWTWVRDAGPRASEALVLLQLIFAGRRARARALSRRVTAGRRRGPAVSGREVLAWLGISPGPEVGRLLAQLQVEIVRGAVRTRRQARRWLQSQSPRLPV